MPCAVCMRRVAVLRVTCGERLHFAPRALHGILRRVGLDGDEPYRSIVRPHPLTLGMGE